EVLEDRTTPAGTGIGLYGQYYTDQTFSHLALTRIDPAINFTWNNVPPAPGMATTNYSIRWTGQLEALNTRPTMIYTKSDDGVRLIIDGKTVIDNWSDHNLTENATKINLVAGQKYLIELDYHQNTGPAAIQLYWASPGWAVIPTSQLYPSQPPTATLNAAGVTTSGAPAYTFNVVYKDNGQLNQASLDGNDVRVTGPNGFAQNAKFLGVTAGAGSWTATYQITPPGGTWDAADNGIYHVYLQANQVTNSLGVAASAGLLGGFVVNVPDWFALNLHDPNLTA